MGSAAAGSTVRRRSSRFMLCSGSPRVDGAEALRQSSVPVFIVQTEERKHNTIFTMHLYFFYWTRKMPVRCYGIQTL